MIGAGLALAAYAAWPTWEGATAQEKFARLVEIHRDYTTSLLRALARPGAVSAAQLRLLQTAARRARSDAEAAAARLADEPAHAPLTPEIAGAVIAAVARLAHAELALHTLVAEAEEPGRSDPGGDLTQSLEILSAALSAFMDDIAAAFRRLQAPQQTTALRPLHAALRATATSTFGDKAIVGTTDRLVDAVDTLGAILRDLREARRNGL